MSQSISQTPSVSQLPSPSGSTASGKSAIPPAQSSLVAQGTMSSSDQLVHSILDRLLPMKVGGSIQESNLATGLVAQTSEQPFKYRTEVSVTSSLAPQALDLMARPSIQEFAGKFARVVVKDLKAEIIPCSAAIGNAFQVTAGWLPAGITTPASTADLKCYPGTLIRTMGGMAFSSHSFEMPCTYDRGIQPVLKAPINFTNTPKFVYGVHSVNKASDGKDQIERVDLFDVVIEGTLVVEGVYVTKW